MNKLLSIVFTLILASQADAQLFRRLSRPTQTCPNGICPSPNSNEIQWYSRDGLSPKAHVEQVHGLNTTGMSHEDILQAQNDYHNRYGSGHQVTQHHTVPVLPQKQQPVPVPPQQSIPVLPQQPQQILSINPNRWI